MKIKSAALAIVVLLPVVVFGQVSEQQLTKIEEANAFRKKLRDQPKRADGKGRRGFKVDPGWQAKRFPDDAVCYLSPAEIANVYTKTKKGRGPSVTSYDRRGGQEQERHRRFARVALPWRDRCRGKSWQAHLGGTNQDQPSSGQPALVL